jgi:hypothetical protein
MGSGALLVEQAAQGTASRYLQRSRRDRDDKTLFPRAVQEEALPYSCVGLLRVARQVFVRRKGILRLRNRMTARTITIRFLG